MTPPQNFQKSDITPLSLPLSFESARRTAKNRFLKSATSERLGSWDPKDVNARGVPLDGMINAYRHWGEGEFGLIITGNIQVDAEQLESAGNCVISKVDQFSGFRFEQYQRLAQAGRQHGSLMIGQISHPGRQVPESINAFPVSASDVQLGDNDLGLKFAAPTPLTHAGIDDIVERFSHAAEYLDRAGFDGVELHAAFGYLLAQFISPSTNKRSDEYGGSLVNRARIVFDIASAIQKRTRPGFVIGVKLNSVEFQKQGLTTDEVTKLCAMMDSQGIDFIELSGGSYESHPFKDKRASTIEREAFFLEFASIFAPVLRRTKMYITGGFKTAGAMVNSLEVGDGVGLARAVTQEPLLVKQILAGKVTGAQKLAYDEYDFGFGLIASGTQIRQLSQDKIPMDLGDPFIVELFREDVRQWIEQMATDHDLQHRSGFIDVTNVPLLEYVSNS